MQKVVTIFGVLIDFHELNEQLSDGVLFETINSTIAILVRQNQTQSRVEIGTNFFPPSNDEALNDVPPLFMGGELVDTAESLFWTCASGILFLVLVEWVEDFPKELREHERL